jgi:FHA domain
MGVIREVSSGRTQLLEPGHLIGRAPTCALRLGRRYVSGQHALLRWTGDWWELRDLGSRNGTYLNGTRLKSGDELPVRVGAKLGFGKLVEEQWELTDASPPTVMAVPVDGGDPAVLDGEMIALPSNDDPRVTIYRGAEGGWVLEQPDELITPITNQQTFDVQGRAWRFCNAENNRTTSLLALPMDLEVQHLQLSFSVSRDEEHVELQISCAGRTFEMGSRSHNYLLLTLARRREEDALEGLSEAACGWIHHEDLAHDSSMAGQQLNIDVFRIRKQFAGVGVTDAANIVERRPRTRQLRIGTGRISITKL